MNDPFDIASLSVGSGTSVPPTSQPDPASASAEAAAAPADPAAGPADTAEARPAPAPDAEAAAPTSIHTVDTHTEGEPTRVVYDGWPEPRGATMAERLEYMRREQDHLRRATVLEPRGHDAMVGALLTPPVDPDSSVGVIFFNNAGYLGMCGHGLIGVVRTLSHIGRIFLPEVRIDTPVGTVDVALGDGGEVTIGNVASRRFAADVAIDVPGVGRVSGDVAWGGNWFFLTELAKPALELASVEVLLRVTKAIRAALDASDVRGENGALIDHVELIGPPSSGDADARAFVLCPGGVYDRSPCGTGTSAKMAVLHANGQLKPGREWRQESITGGIFTGWLQETSEGLLPRLRGRAFVTAETLLRLDPEDPFRYGFGPAAKGPEPPAAG